MDGRLLTEADPPPVEWVNRGSASPVALVCEHAGRAVPARLGGLGLSDAELGRHVAWDIGAARVARRLAELLGAQLVMQRYSRLVMQRYSRLVIDCNRPPDSPLAILGTSDGTDVPANRAMTAAERERRVEEVFRPFDAAVAELLDDVPRRLAFAVHSFTPALGGVARPWDVGFLFRRDSRTSPALAAAVRAEMPELEIGLNEPYRIDDDADWFVPRHAEPRGLGHALIEIRNDHLGGEPECELWANVLARAVRALLAPPP